MTLHIWKVYPPEHQPQWPEPETRFRRKDHLIAVGLFVYREFDEGFPPRFVIRGIPARIERLRPGMSYEEAKEILGLDKPWFQGGTNAVEFMGSGGMGWEQHQFHIGDVTWIPCQTPSGPGEVGVYRGHLILRFQIDTGLEFASFELRGQTVAKLGHESAPMLTHIPGN